MERHGNCVPRDNHVASVIDAMLARKASSLTKLAEMIGVDHSYVSRLRAADRNPSRETALEIFREWPLTERELVLLASTWGFLLPGYTMVKSARADDV